MCFLSQTELSLRQEQQERLVATVTNQESEQLKRFEELMELKQRKEHQSMRDMMEKEYVTPDLMFVTVSVFESCTELVEMDLFVF